MARMIEEALKLLNKLLDLLLAERRKRRIEAKQAEIRDAQSDPGDWFEREFGKGEGDNESN